MLSIIIAVYNSEKYIKRSVLSIIQRQKGLNEYEIVCVNDGSTDNSLQLLKELQKEHKKIRIIDQKNKGVSAARNTGLDSANGDYIMFLDADDFYARNSLKSLVKIMIKEKYDLLQFKIEKTTKSELSLDRAIEYCSLTPQELYNSDATNPFCFSYIYKKELFESLTFREDLHIGEDFVFVESALLKANRIGLVNNRIYGYFKNEASAMNQNLKPEATERFIESYFKSSIIPFALYEKAKLKGVEKGFLFHLENRIYWFFKRAKDKGIPFSCVKVYRKQLPFKKFKALGVTHRVNRLNKIRRFCLNNNLFFYWAYKRKSRKIV